jgi:membrane-bound inhibitor of C-type lysozyme
MVKKIWPVFVLVFLAGCGGKDMRGTEAPQEAGFNPDQRPLGKTMVYECDGNEFIALLGPGEMAMWLEGRYIVLSQVRSASGVKYEEGDTVFWTQGEEAMLVVENQNMAVANWFRGECPGKMPGVAVLILERWVMSRAGIWKFSAVDRFYL